MARGFPEEALSGHQGRLCKALMSSPSLLSLYPEAVDSHVSLHVLVSGNPSWARWAGQPWLLFAAGRQLSTALV